jgi:peptidoglycan-associated lipoprotein
MRNVRALSLLSLALVLALSLGVSGCAKRQLTRGESDRLDALAAKISGAEDAGARECAPRELARAKVALEHARHEAGESFEKFDAAVSDAEKAVAALLEKMKGCRQAGPGGTPSPAEPGKTAPSGPSAPASPGAPPAPAPTAAEPSAPPVPSGSATQPAPFRPAPVPAIQKDEGSFENIYFDFDESAIREDARPVLLVIASYLKNNPKFKLIIEGHCDERGTSEYNMALGQRRADATRAWLLNLGIPASRMTTVSYGKERPMVEGHDEAAWSKNRRAVFVLQ